MGPEITFTLKPGQALVIDGGTVRIIDLNEAVTKGAPCECAAPEPQREATPTTEQQSEPEFEAAQRQMEEQAAEPLSAYDALRRTVAEGEAKAEAERAMQQVESGQTPAITDDDIVHAIQSDPRWRARSLQALQNILSNFVPDYVRQCVQRATDRGRIKRYTAEGKVWYRVAP